VNLANNNFGVDEASSISDYIRTSKTVKSIDLGNNKLTYESAKNISKALKANGSLTHLNVN
jgi:Ran GTPase-activating protein (RanGAP) involved in mRNA processing and transport